MAGPRFLTFKRSSMARRRQIVMQLYLTGCHTGETIAQELEERYDIKVTPATVYEDIKFCTGLATLRAVMSAEELRQLELQKLDHLEQMVLADAEPDVKFDSDEDFVKIFEANTDLKERRSKSAELLLKIAQRRAALKGLDAPVKQEHTGKDGGPIQVEDARAKLLGKLGE